MALRHSEVRGPAARTRTVIIGDIADAGPDTCYIVAASNQPIDFDSAT